MKRWAPARFDALLIVALVLGVFMYRASSVGARSHYWPGALMGLTQASILSSSLLALWAAWQAWRLRAGSVLAIPSVRSRARLLERWFRRGLLVAVLLPLIALAASLPLAGWPRPQDVLLITMAQLQLVAFVGLGAGLGLLLPRPLSLPLALLTPFLVTGLPEAQSQPLWRHLVGVHASCCFVEQQVDNRAILVPLALWLGAAIVLWGGLWWGRGWRSAVGALSLLALVVPLLLVAARPISDIDGAQPRSHRDLQCLATGVELCLWPEQEEQRDAATAAVERYTAIARRTGWQPPRSISSAADAPAAYRAPAGRLASEDVRAVVMAALVVPEFPACAAREPWNFTDVMYDLMAWLQVRSGDLAASRAPASVQQVLARPTSQQDEWFRRNMAQRSACGVEVLR